MATIFDNAEAILAAVGQKLGSSDWLTITQERVKLFADATDDHQWIHVDPVRAKAGPFGATIAHGYLTLSLVSRFLPQIVDVRMKIVVAAFVPVGQPFTYQVVAEDVGYDPAFGVVVTTTLPAGLNVTAIDATGWKCTRSAPRCCRLSRPRTEPTRRQDNVARQSPCAEPRSRRSSA